MDGESENDSVSPKRFKSCGQLRQTIKLWTQGYPLLKQPKTRCLMVTHCGKMGKGHMWRWPKSIKIINRTWNMLRKNPKLNSGWIWIEVCFERCCAQKTLWRPTSGSKATSNLYYLELLKAKKWPRSSIRCLWNWAASPNGHSDNDYHRFTNR